MYSDEKTIPYRPSPAELENLRLLRKRMNPSSSIHEGEEEGISGDPNTWKSDLEPSSQKAEKKIL